MKIRDHRGRPRAHFLGGDYEESMTADVVIDGDKSERVNTGLLDANGEPIYRRGVPSIKFGFVP